MPILEITPLPGGRGDLMNCCYWERSGYEKPLSLQKALVPQMSIGFFMASYRSILSGCTYSFLRKTVEIQIN